MLLSLGILSRYMGGLYIFLRSPLVRRFLCRFQATLQATHGRVVSCVVFQRRSKRRTAPTGWFRRSPVDPNRGFLWVSTGFHMTVTSHFSSSCSSSSSF